MVVATLSGLGGPEEPASQTGELDSDQQGSN